VRTPDHNSIEPLNAPSGAPYGTPPMAMPKLLGMRQKLGLPGGSSCARTKTTFERFGST
jgi:hypothetical protein